MTVLNTIYIILYRLILFFYIIWIKTRSYPSSRWAMTGAVNNKVKYPISAGVSSLCIIVITSVSVKVERRGKRLWICLSKRSAVSGTGSCSLESPRPAMAAERGKMSALAPAVSTGCSSATQTQPCRIQVEIFGDNRRATHAHLGATSRPAAAPLVGPIHVHFQSAQERDI